MATYRPKLGYSAWQVPATPTKYRFDWFKCGVWLGLMVFCLSVWSFVIVEASKLI